MLGTVISGSLEKEIAWSPRSLFPENCGLCAVVNNPHASHLVYQGLVYQQHRGEQGFGWVSLDHDYCFHAHHGLGSVSGKWPEDRVFPGNHAIGHTRYATAGHYNDICNVQPLIFEDSPYGKMSTAHNGTIPGVDIFREKLMQEGVSFHSGSDTEVFAQLIMRSKKKTLKEAIISATKVLPVAYSLLIMTQDEVIALRDKYGVRPLSVGFFESGGALISSENYLFDQIEGIKGSRDVQPGEMVIASLKGGDKGLSFERYTAKNTSFCIFEGIYFSFPRSRYNGTYHEDFRYELGASLARDNSDVHADFVVPILDSGRYAALGASKVWGIPYQESFMRLPTTPYRGRSFTEATTADRKQVARSKLHLRPDHIHGATIVTIDDSVVRSTTTRLINERLYKNGAKKVINGIASPPIIDICPYGMDFQTREELIAYQYPVSEIAERVGSSRIIYLALSDLLEISKKLYKSDVCSGCFGGHYAARGSSSPLSILDDA